MSVFDPYSKSQPITVPGLNTGSATQISTLGPIDTDGLRTNQYRSGLLSALAPFLGWLSIIAAATMGFASGLARLLCENGRLDDVAACTGDPAPLVLVPAAVLLVGLVLAAIGGSLAKRRRAFPSLVVLLAGYLALAGVVTWFGDGVLGLPFP